MHPTPIGRTRSLAAALMAAALLAGCGGAAEGDTATATATAAAVEAAAAPPGATVATPGTTVATGATDAATTVTTPAGAVAADLSAAAAAILDLDPKTLANYAAPVFPVHYDAVARGTDNTPAGNPVTDRAATLGRVLFHDRQLSVNGTVACASCHQQSRGMDDAARFSVGFSGTAFTTAHAMRLGNLRFYGPGTMFWDKRAASVEAQAVEPIVHPVEMGFDASNGGLDALLARMRTLVYYPELFALAFGDAAITEARVRQALAQFQRAMVSTDSAWDRGYATVFDPRLADRGLGIDVPGLNATENRGRQLFVNGPAQGGAGCAACHVPPTFALAGNSRSNGLDAGETRIFKSPSLKNVGLGGAFMHDGRFSTLAQVVEHYDNGVLDGPALDNRLQDRNGQPRRLNLGAGDKAALVAFMNTLTDTTFVSDPKFASPFRR